VEHRRFLAQREASQPFASSDVFTRIGGRATVDALIDGLYDRIEADPSLRPLFSRHLSGERAGQKRFLVNGSVAKEVIATPHICP
jgi:truncated hemoglobin YjbI